MSYKIHIKNYETNNFNIKKSIHIKQICDIDVHVFINYSGLCDKNTSHNCKIEVNLIIESVNCKYYYDCNPQFCECEYNCGESEYQLFHHTILKINEFRILTDDEYIFIQKNIRNILDKINFNKFSGKFSTEDEKEKEESNKFICECIGDNPLIKKGYGECCICYEDTLRDLDCCKGFICYKCWSNIKPKNNGGDINCPLCRNLINSKEKIKDV